jgi:hypothetical protein
MAHRISQASGRAEIAYAGETPWHGLGVKVDGLQTAGDMLRHAGLLWTVSKADIQTTDGAGIDGYKAIRRDDTMTVLGIVTERYEIR